VVDCEAELAYPCFQLGKQAEGLGGDCEATSMGVYCS